MARATGNNTIESCPYVDFNFNITGNYTNFDTLQVVYCTLTVPTSVAAIVGNLLVIIGIWRVPYTNRPSNWIFIFCLALTDLGTGLICQPLFVYVSVAKIRNLVDAAFCSISSKYLFISSYYLGTVCSLMKTAMCLDRFMAVTLQLRYKQFITNKRKTVFLASLCLANIVAGIPGVLGSYYNALRFALVIMLAITSFLMWLLYQKVECIVRRESRQIEDAVESSEDLQRINKDIVNLTNCKKSLLSARIVNNVFLLFSVPYIVTVTWMQVTSTDSLTLQCALWFSTTLFYFSSSVNPFVHLWFHSNVRDAAFGAVSKCFSILHI